MLCRAKTSSVSQVGLDAATDSVLFFPTGGVSFCSGVDRARGSFGEPKVTPPFLVYTLSDVTSPLAQQCIDRIPKANRCSAKRRKISPRTSIAYSEDLRPEFTRSWSAESHSRF